MPLIDDLINILRLRVELYHNARVCGNWEIHEHSLGRACFHMPSQGDCLLHVPGEGDWHLAEGDVVIFPKELIHTMVPAQPLAGPQEHLPIGESQATPGTSMLCGSILFHHSGGEQLINILPPVVIVSLERARHWLAPLTELIVHESMVTNELNSPVLNRLCEILVAYTLRCYSENYPQENGLLAVYSHPKLHRAIKAIHQNPAHNWQLASLAREAVMSRTRFSQLFTEVAGMTATQYLTWWRMQVAYSELQQGHSVEQVADNVGYSSEAAFARAFKKVFNQTVGHVRNRANPG